VPIPFAVVPIICAGLPPEQIVWSDEIEPACTMFRLTVVVDALPIHPKEDDGITLYTTVCGEVAVSVLFINEVV
jgi:hypothetical protein